MNGAHAKLDGVRAAMRDQDLQACIVPRADEHLGEYVPPSAERLSWLTGFTGSAGLAIVLPDRAAVFTDGRYTLQLEAQTDPALFERHHLIEEPPTAWLAATAQPGDRIGYDPMLMSADSIGKFAAAGLTMVPTAPSPIDVAWHDRPHPPRAAVVPHELRYAGKSSADKRAEIAAAVRAAKQDVAIVTDPASIAWLLNIRGADLEYAPFALGFMFVGADEAVTLIMDPAKLSHETRSWLGNAVTLRSHDELEPSLAALAGKRVGVDAAGSSAWFGQRLRAAGATVLDAPDPCALPKARKNPVEQQNAREVHRRDAVALCRFLHWLDGAAGHTTEIGAAAQLLAYRSELPNFRGESFPTISGAGEHAAIIHYRVSPETDRPIRRNEIYLNDSGAQFVDGTTDVTRTVWTGPEAAPAELRDRVTRVLQGHIAIATAVFPEGVCGPHLDPYARRALWQIGLDYDHGTGHGVGSFLSVHEGPVSLSRNAKMIPLAEGMILSDEPGYYLPGAYGIRLENLLLVQNAPFEAAKKPFLQFETLTLAPFDRRLVETSIMTPAERHWLDTYHARVFQEVGPSLPPIVRDWLAAACAPLG